MRYGLNRTNTSTVAEMRIQQNPRGEGGKTKDDNDDSVNDNPQTLCVSQVIGCCKQIE
jgi:hypothetical protein